MSQSKDSVLVDYGTSAYSVSELNRQAKNLLEASFKTISVNGEISNLSVPASGHWYFSLKDDKAQVRCAMFRSANKTHKNPPKDGSQVVVKGKVSLYEGRGEFQLIVNRLDVAGAGALLLAYENLKKQLAVEGLFAETRKQKLPTHPKRIAIITSPTGAVIRDIITVLNRRFAAIGVLIYPVSVQGDMAAGDISSALKQVDRDYRKKNDCHCDVIIIARGGGSLEDLWAFNDETLARTIADCQIPVVSAVGHETDFTICDLAADVRAPTPSAAAEKVSPDSFELKNKLIQLEQRLINALRQLVKNKQSQCRDLSQRLKHPTQRLQELYQRLDDNEARLKRLTRSIVLQRHTAINQLTERLEKQHPRSRLKLNEGQLGQLQTQLIKNINIQLSDHYKDLETLSKLMHSVSPLATLSRGYSITMDANGEIIQSCDQISQGDVISTRIARGEIKSEVMTKAEFK